MAYTDTSDAYGSITDTGINRVVSHVRRKRPSLFNYATRRVAADPAELMCAPIDAASEVTDNGNPLVTVQEDPVPVIGTDGLVALEYCFQITSLELDFSPGDVIEFPEDSDLDVGDQEFGVAVEVCAGLACPDDEQLRELIAAVAFDREDLTIHAAAERETVVPTPKRLHCFCLTAFLVGTVEMGRPGIHTRRFTVDESPQFRIHDIAIGGGSSGPTHGGDASPSALELPDGLRRSFECYLELTVELGLLPEIALAVARVVPKLVEMLEGVFDLSGTTLAVSTPTSGAVPNNPAIEDDRLSLFLDVAIGGANP